MEAKDVKEFFERVASDWDAMRLAYYDERVIEKIAAVSGATGDMAVATSALARVSSPPG